MNNNVEDKLPIAFRYSEDSDRNFIINSYLKSYRESPETSALDNDTFFGAFKVIIETLIEDSKSVLIACDPEHKEQIFSYIIVGVSNDQPILHYVYTKFPFRHFGLARRLLNLTFPQNEEIVCTHSTRTFKHLKEKYRLVLKPELKIINQ